VLLLPTSAPIVPQVPQNPYGITDEQEKFQLSTYGNSDGAAEGGYQVVLLWPDENASSEAEGASQDRFLGWYDATRTQLTVNIKTGTNELPAFKIPKVTRPPEDLKGVPGRNYSGRIVLADSRAACHHEWCVAAPFLSSPTRRPTHGRSRKPSVSGMRRGL
jgi:hypothetical protein